MAIRSETCPACGAPVELPEHNHQTRCFYCATPLLIEHKHGEISLKLGEQLTDSIESTGSKTQAVIQTGTAATQAALNRLQLVQELSNAQLRLSNLQSEIRTLERAKPDRIIQQQLHELRGQEATLHQQITRVQSSLNPVSPAAVDQHTTAQKRKSIGLKLDSKAWPSLLFSFYGQIERTPYWLGLALAWALLYIGSFFTTTVTDPVTGTLESEPTLVTSLLIVVALWIFLAVHVKRFRARGKSGWWTLIWFVPFGFLWVLYELGFQPGGTRDGNWRLA